jgi:phosphocarrier protein
MPTAQHCVTVIHETGLHARPASKFVQTAAGFDSEIRIGRPTDGETVDAKSSIQVLSLGIEQGEDLEITADGADSGEAVDRLVKLVENDFELDE